MRTGQVHKHGQTWLACSRDSTRLVQCDPWTTAPIREMADGAGKPSAVQGRSGGAWTLGSSGWRCISNSVFSARTGADISRGNHRCRTSTSRSTGRRIGSIWGRHRPGGGNASEFSEGCEEGCSRATTGSHPPAKDAESEIAALRARLASVEEERDTAMEGRPAKRVATGPQFRGETTRDRPGRLREEFMPMCDEEIFQWMQDRQADLHDATLTGSATEVSRLCHDGRCSHFVFEDSPV